jgi:ComF family protein
LAALPRTRLHLEVGNEMEKNLWGKMPIERASAFLYYAKGGDVRKLLFDLKYYDNPSLGYFLGRIMARELLPSRFFEGVDYILPVPLHPKKLKSRGYNQSAMLAEGIASVTMIPVMAHGLVKSTETETQTRKGRYERWLNVKEGFTCPSGKGLENKHILLVDDVMTTGATVVACADAMARIPGLRISVLTLALAGDM